MAAFHVGLHQSNVIGLTGIQKAKHVSLEAFFIDLHHHVTMLIISLMRQLMCYISRPRGKTTFSMLNSTEHEIDPAHKC